MISDVLFDAREDIKRMLNDPVYMKFYGPEMRRQLEALCEEMERIRKEIDGPPLADMGSPKH